jgi:hypothetical protein
MGERDKLLGVDQPSRQKSSSTWMIAILGLLITAAIGTAAYFAGRSSNIAPALPKASPSTPPATKPAQPVAAQPVAAAVPPPPVKSTAPPHLVSLKREVNFDPDGVCGYSFLDRDRNFLLRMSQQRGSTYEIRFNDNGSMKHLKRAIQPSELNKQGPGQISVILPNYYVIVTTRGEGYGIDLGLGDGFFMDASLLFERNGDRVFYKGYWRQEICGE